MGGKRTTFKDLVTGRWTRVCCDCHETKDLERDFYKARRVPIDSPTDWTYQCKLCKRASVRQIAHRQRADPKRGAELRAMYTRLQREWRKRNPQRAKANAERYRRRLRKDPQRHARHLESIRIAYRLRAERNGAKVTRTLSTVTLGKDNLPKFPARPLAELLSAMAEHRDGGMAELAHELDFNARSHRAWKTGERHEVQFDVVDRILTAAGLMWWEVWTEDEYPEVHEVMSK